MKVLRDTDRVALLKLLADEDPHVLQLLKDNFTQMGSEGVAFLESVPQDRHPVAWHAANEILRDLRENQAWAELTAFCKTCPDHFDLEASCWLLAKTRYPELDGTSYQARLDEMARELRKRMTGRETPRSTIEVCNHFLFRTLGFRGNHQDYYDADNSYLNRVLDRRLGIPLSLSLLYLSLARRLNLPLVGVNLPGHFLLKWHSTTAHFFVDAFNEGQILDVEDCRGICERLGHQFRTAYLSPVTPRQIFLRMCRNVQAIYAEKDPPRAERIGQAVTLLARD